MPRNSDRRKRRTDLSTRGSAKFQMIDPTRHLSTHSSGALVPVSDFKPHQEKGHEWQKDAFIYNRLIGEVGFLHDTTARLVAACDLIILEDVEDLETATVVPKVASDPRVNRVMRAFTGPVGGRKELLRRASLHYQIAGESILVATPLKDDLGLAWGYSWEFLSPREIKSETKKVKGESVTVVWRQSGSDDDDFLPVDASLARWWRSDPEFSARADSPLRRVLPICRELVILSEVVDAIAKSRLNAGILLIPDELSYGPDEETSEEGTEIEEIDKLVQDLIEHLTSPVEDRSSGSSLVPLILKGQSEFLDKIKMIWLSRDLTEPFQAIRDELLVRIAQGLDAPPEMIYGKAKLNHWSAYSVDNEFIDKFVTPLGEALCEFLTVSYLRRMLVLHENMTPEEANRFRIILDPRPLAHRDDESDLAAAGWDRIIISDDTWLTSNGFTAGDRPSEDERKRRVLEKVIFSAPGIFGPGLLPVLYPELKDAMASAASADQQQRQQNEENGPSTPQAEDPVDTPAPIKTDTPANGIPEGGPPTDRPDGTPPVPVQKSVTPEDVLADRLATAADAALKRAMERAASRVLSRMNGKHDNLRLRINDLPKYQVLSKLTQTDLVSLSVDANVLFNDAWDMFAESADPWIQDWATSTGASTVLAREVAKLTVKNICRGLDVLARSGVGGPIPVSTNGLCVPASMVDRSVKQAMEEIRARS